MNEKEKNPDKTEILLRQFEPARPSELKKQQILTAAKDAWRQSQSRPAISLMRYIKAIAACLAIVIAIEITGSVSLSRWRFSAGYPKPEQTQTALQEYSEISPSARYYSSISHRPARSNVMQLRQYRNQLQNLLDETVTEPSQQPVRQNQSQGKYTPSESIRSFS